MVYPNILSSATVVNIDNNKDWSKMLKIQLCITGINYIVKYFFIIFHNISIFTVFLIK